MPLYGLFGYLRLLDFLGYEKKKNRFFKEKKKNLRRFIKCFPVSAHTSRAKRPVYLFVYTYLYNYFIIEMPRFQ